jgi:hypothetical protein
MGVWGLTWFLSSAGGFVAASIAEFMGAPFAVALGALSVASFAVVLYLTSAEVRQIPALENDAHQATSPEGPGRPENR